jgi:Anti-sigma-K factor rskA, C-terminal/Sigma-70, region 4
MTPLDTLAPDQRAVLELVLRQGRSYGELSELLGIPERDVRARADAGIRTLAGEADAGVDTGRIADWLLGQQPEAEAERTRTAVARSAPSRTWAAAAAEHLRELGGTAVPDVPAAEATEARPRPLRESAPPAAARPRPVREKPAAEPRSLPRSSKIGGAIVIGVLVVAVAGLIVFLVSRGDDNEPAASSQQQAQSTATPTPTATASANDIVLKGTNGSKAAGLMRLISANGNVQFALAAQNVPPNQGREVYAVWFTRSGVKPVRLGFAQSQVGKEGVLTTGGPQKRDLKNFPRWFATYSKVLVTRETNAKATQPGPAVLEGTLPNGA